MRYKSGMFIFTALSGLGGLAAFLQWLGIRPRDVWGWHVSLAIPHWLWLIVAVLLFAFSIGLSTYGLYYNRQEERLKEIEAKIPQPVTVDGILAGLPKQTVTPPLSPPHSKLTIRSANYRAWKQGGEKFDVTDFLRKIVVSDSLVHGPIENHSFAVDGKNYVPRDPLVSEPKRLEVTYSYNGEEDRTIQRSEHSRMVLPEDSEIARLQKDLSHCQAELSGDRIKLLSGKADAENKLIQLEAQQASLLNRITAVVRQALTFLRDQGPSPEVKFKEMKTEKGKRYLEDTEKRIHRIHSGFSLRLHPEIDKITLELGENGIFDYDLAALMKKSEHSEANIHQIVDKLIALRDRLEKQEYGGE